MCHHHRLKGSQVSRESWPLYLRKTWRSLDFTIPKRSTKNCQFRTFCFFTFSKFCCIQAYSFSAKALSLLQTFPGRHAIVGRHLRKGTYPKKWIESTSIDIMNRYILRHSVHILILGFESLSHFFRCENTRWRRFQVVTSESQGDKHQVLQLLSRYWIASQESTELLERCWPISNIPEKTDLINGKFWGYNPKHIP